MPIEVAVINHKVLSQNWSTSLFTLWHFLPLAQAFLSVLDQCPKIEVDVPLVKSYLAQFAARAIIAELVSVAELAHPLENGTHFPLFLLCLQQTAKLKDKEWLTDLFQQSKVNMQKMLPGTSVPLSLSPVPVVHITGINLPTASN